MRKADMRRLSIPKDWKPNPKNSLTRASPLRHMFGRLFKRSCFIENKSNHQNENLRPELSVKVNILSQNHEKYSVGSPCDVINLFSSSPGIDDRLNGFGVYDDGELPVEFGDNKQIDIRLPIQSEQLKRNSDIWNELDLEKGIPLKTNPRLCVQFETQQPGPLVTEDTLTSLLRCFGSISNCTIDYTGFSKGTRLQHGWGTVQFVDPENAVLATRAMGRVSIAGVSYYCYVVASAESYSELEAQMFADFTSARPTSVCAAVSEKMASRVAVAVDVDEGEVDIDIDIDAAVGFEECVQSAGYMECGWESTAEDGYDEYPLSLQI